MLQGVCLVKGNQCLDLTNLSSLRQRLPCDAKVTSRIRNMQQQLLLHCCSCCCRCNCCCCCSSCCCRSCCCCWQRCLRNCMLLQQQQQQQRKQQHNLHIFFMQCTVHSGAGYAVCQLKTLCAFKNV